MYSATNPEKFPPFGKQTANLQVSPSQNIFPNKRTFTFVQLPATMTREGLKSLLEKRHIIPLLTITKCKA